MKSPKIKQGPEAIVLGLVVGLLAIHFLLQWKWDKDVSELIYMALFTGLLSVLSKKIAFWIATGWMSLGELMGKVVGGVLLSVVFLFILTPLAKLRSVFSKNDKFKTAKRADCQSSWIARKHVFGRKDLEELW